MSTIIAAGLTHVGRVRSHNQDAYWTEAEDQMFVVADGMGGHAAGELASQMAVQSVRDAWRSVQMRQKLGAYAVQGDIARRGELLHSLRQSVLDAHEQIMSRAAREPDKEGMGTTFTGLVVAGGEALFAHAGDSRAYLVRDRIPLQLSEDHTMSSRLRAESMARGLAAPETGKWKGVLTNVLGMEGAPHVTTFVVPLYSGDRIVLSTDGIHDYLNEVEIGEAVLEAPSPARAAQILVDRALERGGADNATVIVAKVVEAGETPIPPATRRRHEESIKACPLFAGLSEQEVLRALRISTPRTYGPGRELPVVALEDRVAYVLLHGSLDGHTRGSVIYPSALVRTLEGRPPAQLSTTTECVLLMIRRNDLVELGQDDPALGDRLYQSLEALAREESSS